ncbi:MAG: hypothetical protein OEW88_01945 [Gammaproteobacteria bacterium]|nr:hypothetical protein [Gammaproteobacteria bacterium]MDH5275164.1 hypothetical protein [Gammaproteobacteria bacterium]
MMIEKISAVRAAALGVALTLSGAASAAEISNISGQSCGALTGEWHFVNNQTGTRIPGTLTASWSSGDSCTVGPSKVNQSTQHFYCSARGELLSASSTLAGRLVLSDFSCEDKKCEIDPKTKECVEPPPPPPCDKDCK